MENRSNPTETHAEAAQYPVATLEQMAEIPLDALPRFLAELPAMIGTVHATKALNAILEPLGGKVELQVPIWVDDDKNTGTIILQDAEGQQLSQTIYDLRTGSEPNP